MKQINYNGLIFISYITPLILSFAIYAFFTGSFYSPVYGINYTGLHARLISIVIVIFCCCIFFNLLVSIPKKNGGKEKSIEIIKLFISSPFFYILLLFSFSLVFLELFMVRYGSFIYLGLLIFCFMSQLSFNRKYQSCLNDEL
jgi:hypothetical protein